MGKGLKVMGGIGLGAGLMYLLDPQRGNRRRAVIRDKVFHALNKTRDAWDATASDLRNRARGAVAELRGAVRREEVSDPVLAERVRAKIGRVVSHPGSIEVTAEEGRVRLSGAILAHEVEPLLAAVRRVRGVKEVENRLEVHTHGGDEPGLQGGSGRTGERPEFFQTNWSPAARLLAGAAGGALVLLGTRRGGLVGTTVGTLGLGVLARGATNLELKRLVGVGAGRGAIRVHKNITIGAPVNRVFAVWSEYQHFPSWMSHVRDVRDLGGGRSHWAVEGPGGARLEWDAVLTKVIPNEELAWETEPGASVQHTGRVRFQPNPDGTTRVDIQMCYTPPAGAVGGALAGMAGAGPKERLDDDLARLKTYIETGTPPHDAQRTLLPGGAR